ncbi:MAG: type II toxin-antitoxin system VapC family toxin [Rhodospirillales bacterium]|nr:type II toxin-antitoxin system VapC family toxin [Rhodospirillales bacterium]
MRVLLDTHALLWWVEDSPHLSASARKVVADEANEILVSAASAWEIATKYRLGKLPEAEAVATDVVGCIADEGFEALAISVADAERAGRLPGIHRDPFDRMIIAQALGHDLAIVSVDATFDRYGVNRLW